jgi:methyl-accepting chemotaxis protein
MRSFPSAILFLLLLAMCGLCGVQWWRESQLREIAVGLRSELNSVTHERDDLLTRAKAADAEILRLTGAFTELRANSVPREEVESMLQTLEDLRCQMHLQNQAVEQQNEAVQKQSMAMQKANTTIQSLATEREDLAKRLNEVTTKYNTLLKKP